MIGRILELLTGDASSPEREKRPDAVPMFSAFLGYRAFEPEGKIFFQRRSRGFILELYPLIGADERVAETLNSLVADLLRPGCECQITNYADPRIAEKLAVWALPRVKAGGVFARMAQYRLDMLKRGVWKSLATDGPFVLRQFRVILSVSVSEKSALTVSELVGVRQSLISALQSINVGTLTWGPTELIRFIDDVLCPSSGAGDEAPEYSSYDPINEQCVRRDLVTHIDPRRIILEAPSLRPSEASVDGQYEMVDYSPHRFDVRSMSVRYFPERWAPWDTAKIIGDLFDTQRCLPCPVLQTLSIVIPDIEVMEAKVSWKFTRTTSLADTQSARFLPQLKRQSEEWQHVSTQMKLGQKLCKVYYSVSMISPLGEGDTNAAKIKQIYKGAGWDLIDETYLQAGSLLASLPLTLADGLSSDLDRMKRFRKVLSFNAASLAPVQGEYNGGIHPHLLFLGRRGQPMFWSPFENGAGNHNVAIAGKSGSGKSVTLQDLTASFTGVGAKVVVIDDGRSFEHMAKALGGRFVEFRLSSGISVNPFRMIDADLAASDQDYLVDCLAMLKAIISQMARFEDRLSDTERGLIDAAVNDVWKAKGRDALVDDIMAALRAIDHPAGKDLATALLPFAAEGTFGQFFTGDANLDLSAGLTVFELSDLSGREELRSVVLTAIMFLASQAMRKLARTTPKALIIDEAWQMLKGGAMSEFVEVYSRTCRKYGGSLVTATQSINDFYKSPGSQAALENSDWMLVLQQKPETIADFRKSDRFEMDNQTDALLRSLKRHGTEYSDILIRGPEMQAVCRLVLDPFSATLYSSSPTTFGKIEAAIGAGASMAEAIEAVAFDRPWHLEAEAAE